MAGSRRGKAAVFVAALALAPFRAFPESLPPDVGLFFQAASRDERAARAARVTLAASWRDGYTGMIVDLARLMRSPRRRGAGDAEPSRAGPAFDDSQPGVSGPGAFGVSPPTAAREPVDPSSLVRARLLGFLGKRTGQRFGDDLGAWRRWLWSQPYDPHPDLALFKSTLYAGIDPRMAAFFPPGARASIRLDEVDWGGVAVNGIPPLDHPKNVPAREAGYLKETNVVFGIAVNGEARAYPKRILAWHELARDRLGGVELVIVYCTLCGTVIPYGAELGGVRRTFGTSGLLYRSNKLMFDEESLSLWSASEGRPVVGPLAGAPLELSAYPVVTTTWRAWLAAHPDTSVLSIETGFARDYAEGAAYRDYFATDRLMFEVPRIDKRLKNKAEVVGLLLRPASGPAGSPRLALALAVDFLERNPVHQRTFAGRELLFLTSPGGATRVYESGAVRIDRLRADGRAEDSQGRTWRLGEEGLLPDAAGATALPRIPARRAFWFGWQAQFPETELVR